jgi:hypothetical protein
MLMENWIVPEENWDVPDTQGEPAAPGGWFICDVTLAGPAETGEIYLKLKEVGGQFDRWYSPVSLVRNEMLATALTAITLGVPVWVGLSTTDEWGRIERLYLIR